MINQIYKWRETESNGETEVRDHHQGQAVVWQHSMVRGFVHVQDYACDGGAKG